MKITLNLTNYVLSYQEVVLTRKRKGDQLFAELKDWAVENRR
jgi:hypothetical protein